MDYNVDRKVSDFIKAIDDQLKHYQTNHIMFTMGSDFQFESAREWYKNLDKIIKYTMMKVHFTISNDLFYCVVLSAFFVNGWY